MDGVPQDALTTFLYLLMRDALPTGRVRTLIDNATAAEYPSFSSPELHMLAARYAGELAERDVVDAEVEEEPGALQAIDAAKFGNAGIFVPLGADEFDPAMKAWLDLFDDRIRGLDEFVEAVNEAAEWGAPLSEVTAQSVAGRARELHELAVLRRSNEEVVRGG